MNKERSNEIKVGFTVIVGILLFIWVLGWAKNFSFSEKYNAFKVEFPTVSGLSSGDVVTVNGVKKGYVETITLAGNKAITEVKLENDVVLNEDATFSIMMLDLMGGKKIEIFPGNSETKLDMSQVIPGEYLGDIASAMAALSSVQNDVIVLIKEVRSAVTKVNATILSDEFIASLNGNLTDLNMLLRNVNNLVDNNKDEISTLLENSNKLVQSGQKFIDENGDSISQSIKSVNKLLENSNRLVSQINEFIDETKAGDNNIGDIIYDEKLLNEMKETLIGTNNLIKILLDQLKKEGIKVDAYIF